MADPTLRDERKDNTEKAFMADRTSCKMERQHAVWRAFRSYVSEKKGETTQRKESIYGRSYFKRRKERQHGERRAFMADHIFEKKGETSRREESIYGRSYFKRERKDITRKESIYGRS